MQCELNSTLVLSRYSLAFSTKLVWPSRIDAIGLSMLRPLIGICYQKRIEARLHGVIVISSDEEDEEEVDEEREECEEDGEDIGEENEEEEDDYDRNDPFIDDTPQDYQDKKKPKLQLYEHLELEMGCSKDDMKKKYKILSVKWHPDKNDGSPEALDKMQKITMAFRILMNDRERRKYSE